MSAIAPYEWAIIAFVIGVAFLCAFMLTVPLLLGGKSWGRAKQEQFESGIVGAGGARIRLSAKFYLVAIFFVVFDIEALYLYAWSSALRETGWLGFSTATIFIVDLLIGLVYAVAVGALNWAPFDKWKAAAKLPVQTANTDLAAITRFNNVEELIIDPTGKIPAQCAAQQSPATHVMTKE